MMFRAQSGRKEMGHSNNDRKSSVAISWAFSIFYVHQGKGKDLFKNYYLASHSTHFIYGYTASDIYMVKDHSDSERGKPVPPHGLLLPISRKGYFLCLIPQTG